uniref:Spliceosome-associated protein CWC27 homolog n=1 Tax=Callithrix jacchus TaxID=9483 RepID=F7I1G1_CALJA
TSNSLAQDPPTLVLLKTTAGDIDIELWSKEAPKACRNFIQLCLEAYYDNTIFHRVVPGFIVQGGDPTGTGTGGESIYGAPFKDEFHSRLRFNRRGLVAMANAGSHDNGSQFFFTLGRADELNNKHTIFGKVTGDTVYNMLRLSEVDIDDEERPHNPHKIKSCEVLFNPFDDIIPREIKRSKKEKPEEEWRDFSASMKGKSKSSHDLLKDDPHLSSVPVVESEKGDASGDSDDDGEDESAEHDEYIDGDEKNLMRERIAKKLKKDTSTNVKSAGDGEVEKSVSRSEELRKEARQLKRELLAAKQKKGENAAKQAEKTSEEEEATPDGAIAEYRREKQKYEALRKQQSKKGTSREDQTLALLNQFKSKLTQAIAEMPENDTPETEVEDDEGWMSHVLQFEDKSRKVKDASMQDSDTFEIYDPRNPVNKRRREESKKLMREKKERR